MKHNFNRKLMVFIAAIVLLVSANTVAYAAETIPIFIDGVELDMDVPPKIINERTMIPIRAVSEAVGCTVDWQGDDKRVVVNSPAGGDPIIVMHVGDPTVTVNTYNGNTGEVTSKRVTIDSPPVIIDNRTLVPLRFIAETIGFTVKWENGMVLLNSALYESPVDPDDSSVPNWWGKYKSEDTNFSIGITNFNGQGFWFGFYNLRNGKLFYDGTAGIYSDDGLLAEYGELSFSLSNDFDVIGIFAPEGSEWAHLSGRYERIDSGEVTPYDNKYSLRLDFGIDGLVWESGNENLLDGNVKVYSDNLGSGNDIETKIMDYLSLQDEEVSEWLSLHLDEALSEKVGYPVWIAEYYVGHEEDTNLCLDAIVLVDDFNGSDYALLLHTIRDADLDMNTDTDYGARIWELFATIEVATV